MHLTTYVFYMHVVFVVVGTKQSNQIRYDCFSSLGQPFDFQGGSDETLTNLENV